MFQMEFRASARLPRTSSWAASKCWFNAVSVVVSVLAESLALGAIGGVLGGLAAYAVFNGYQTSTINFQTFSQVAFAFTVTPELLALGLIYALAMGLIGGLLPAVRAARLPIPTALREL